MRPLAPSLLAVLATVVVASTPARADRLTHRDVASAALEFCADANRGQVTDADARAASDRICNQDAKQVWLAHLGDRLPPSAFAGDVCADVAILSAKAGVALDSLPPLEQVCKASRLAAAPTAVTAVLINVVTGLGEHIAATARADLVDYVTSNLTSKLCKTDADNPLALGALLISTCKLFSGDQPVDTLTLSQVKTSLLQDVHDLPRTVPDKVGKLVTDYLQHHQELETAVGIAVGIVVAVREVYQHRREPTRILDDALIAVLGDGPQGPSIPGLDDKLICSLVKDPTNTRCLLVLAARLVRDFETHWSKDIDDHIPELLEASLRTFCKGHGGGDDTKCVIDDGYDKRWHAKIVRIYDALVALFDEQEQLAADAEKVGGDSLASGTSFPVLDGRIDELLAALVALGDDGSDRYRDTSSLYLALADLTMAGASADFPAARSALTRVLANPIIDKKLGTTTYRALTFVVSLANAKDATEAKAVIDAVAAPAGTYKEKYARDTWYLAIESFIGPMYSFEEEDFANSSMTTSARVKRFGAPVGIELMPAWLSGEYVNVGVGATLIDPLALAAVDGNGNSPDSNLGSVLDFGGYLRIGIAKSPVSLVAGGAWRPGLRASTDCTATAGTCYAGVRELYLGVVADVPLLVLH